MLDCSSTWLFQVFLSLGSSREILSSEKLGTTCPNPSSQLDNLEDLSNLLDLFFTSNSFVVMSMRHLLCLVDAQTLSNVLIQGVTNSLNATKNDLKPLFNNRFLAAHSRFLHAHASARTHRKRTANEELSRETFNKEVCCWVLLYDKGPRSERGPYEWLITSQWTPFS